MRTQNLLHHLHHQKMNRKIINIIILIFVLGMGIYHIVPSKFLIGRLVYYICLYGSITAFLFHMRYVSLEKKYKKFYLIASFYSISKMIYHLWVAANKYRYEEYIIEYEKSLIEYEKGIIDFTDVVVKYNQTLTEYNFDILGVKCELFAFIFSAIVFVTLILFKFNNDG